jgi:predicted ATP-grasp superfamily ATP-dependent carboligase
MNKAGDFNHDARTTKEACGLKGSKLEKRYEKFVEGLPEEETKFSIAVEHLVNSFNKRELAYLLVKVILTDSIETSSPIEELMELFSKERE